MIISVEGQQIDVQRLLLEMSFFSLTATSVARDVIPFVTVGGSCQITRLGKPSQLGKVLYCRLTRS